MIKKLWYVLLKKEKALLWTETMIRCYEKQVAAREALGDRWLQPKSMRRW